MSFDQLDPAVVRAGDIFFIAVVLGALVDFLPSLATVLTVVWMAIRIWETRTVQGIIARLRRRMK
jgi:hypothetical protein